MHPSTHGPAAATRTPCYGAGSRANRQTEPTSHPPPSPKLPRLWPWDAAVEHGQGDAAARLVHCLLEWRCPIHGMVQAAAGRPCVACSPVQVGPIAGDIEKLWGPVRRCAVCLGVLLDGQGTTAVRHRQEALPSTAKVHQSYPVRHGILLLLRLLLLLLQLLGARAGSVSSSACCLCRCRRHT
jgi:hypothetical protein